MAQTSTIFYLLNELSGDEGQRQEIDYLCNSYGEFGDVIRYLDCCQCDVTPEIIQGIYSKVASIDAA